MGQGGDNPPPIRLTAGGRRGQLIVAIGALVATILLYFFGNGDARFLGFLLVLLSAAFFYRYSNRSVVSIFDDHLEYNQWSNETTSVHFKDIKSVELRIKKNWANDYYITVDRGGDEERILLPSVYNDVFDPLKRAIIRWYSKDGPLDPVHTITDGSDETLWKAPWRRAT